MYITKAELRAEPYNVTETEAPDARLDALITQAKDDLDFACLQRFDTHDRVITGYGTGTPQFRPMQFDVAPYGRHRSLTAITVAGTACLPADFIVYPWEIVRKAASVDLLPPIFDPDAQIVVTIACGWASIPARIKYLQAMIVLRALRPELAEGWKTSQESFTGYSYTRRQLAGPSPFGDVELDAIVQEYRAPGSSIAF